MDQLNQSKERGILKILSVPKQLLQLSQQVVLDIMRCPCQHGLVLTFNLYLSEENWSKNNLLQSCSGNVMQQGELSCSNTCDMVLTVGHLLNVNCVITGGIN